MRLRSFHKTSSDELENALQDLEEQNITSLVLDLRNNPGSLLEQAISVTDAFIKSGQLIVYTKGRLASQNMKGFSRRDTTHMHYPIVILVNEHTAAGAEIVAGALQDLGRAMVVGTPTFGRGTIQTNIPLSDGSGLRLTTGRLFTPRGRAIQGKGLTPDIVVKSVRPQVVLLQAHVRPKP